MFHAQKRESELYVWLNSIIMMVITAGDVCTDTLVNPDRRCQYRKKPKRYHRSQERQPITHAMPNTCPYAA